MLPSPLLLAPTVRPSQANAVMQRHATADMNIKHLLFMMKTETCLVDNFTAVIEIFQRE